MRDKLYEPIVAPALLSVSGGRSSGMTLKIVLDEHDGKLPDGVIAVFANTGEEAEGTLGFVKEMSERWNVPIRWVEFTRESNLDTPSALGHWREVDYCTASRKGEPFDQLIDWKKYLPNPTQRICSEWLKVRAVVGFAASLGFPTKRIRKERRAAAESQQVALLQVPSAKKKTMSAAWDIVADFDSVLGIRADEPRRVAKQRAKENIVLPLVDRGIVSADVFRFWSDQPFDLQVRKGEGNCKLCFEKGGAQLRGVVSSSPDSAGIERWEAREARVGATFKKGDSYAAIADNIKRQLPIFTNTPEDDYDARPCSCGD